MKCVIIANAPGLDAAPYAPLIAAADLLLAADGGALPLIRLGHMPETVVGDLDSLDAASVALLADAGVAIDRHPRAKDETDLELALLLAAERGAAQILVLGALGGRWDHTLANVALLALPELRGRDVRLLDGDQTLYLVRERAELDGHRGDTISLVPLTGAVHGITTRGLQYALEDATLSFERARGVSNVLLDPPGAVSIRDGLLLVIHHDDGGRHQFDPPGGIDD